MDGLLAGLEGAGAPLVGTLDVLPAPLPALLPDVFEGELLGGVGLVAGREVLGAALLVVMVAPTALCQLITPLTV